MFLFVYFFATVVLYFCRCQLNLPQPTKQLLCILKISPLDRSMSQSNQNPTFDDDNKIEYFCSIEICGDNGDVENEGRDGEKKTPNSL